MVPILAILLPIVAAQKYLQIPIQKAESGCTSHSLKRNAVCVPLDNAFTSYVLSLKIGTPPQPVRVIVDTGSSDFIVLMKNHRSSNPSNHQKLLFNHRQSSTFRDNKTMFESKFMDGAVYSGFFGQDILNTSGLIIDNFNFAVASTKKDLYGIAGIGFPENESPVVGNELNAPYSNLPMQLKEHGYISHTVFSLWLNSWSEEFGALTFGAIDLTCVNSILYTFPIVDSQFGLKDHFTVRVSDMYLVNSDGRHQKFYEGSLPVILDSGTSVSRLPPRLIKPFYDALGAVIDAENVATIPCSKLTKGGGIGIVVNGIELLFSLADIAAPYDMDSFKCIPGITPGPIASLGANFLKSLYVVFDLENLEIGIAEANTDPSVRTIKPHIYPLSEGIPGIRAPMYNLTYMDVPHTTYPVKFGRGLSPMRAKNLPTITLGSIKKRSLSWHRMMQEYYNDVALIQ